MTNGSTAPLTGTLLLDFDSTLIEVESLEEILKPRLAADLAVAEEFQAITRAGMEGRMSFEQSLQRRLQIAPPNLADVRAFGRKALALLTPGMAAMIANLRRQGAEVRIASGGLREAILPTARRLGIPDDQVHAVRLKWDTSGSFLGTQFDDSFHISKVEGIQCLVNAWPRPIIAVGDGMTDYQIFQHGLADHFVAFTLHVRRAAVVATGAPIAANVDQLTRLLEDLL